MSTQAKLAFTDPSKSAQFSATLKALLAGQVRGPGFHKLLETLAVAKFGSLETEASLARFYTQDPGTLSLLDDIRLVSNYSCPVLITGESGTGKELLARALHGLRPGNFVPVNCTSLPSELIESELFGHTQGAFTGAIRKRDGKIAAAIDGTLFLDEIGDMPLDMQAKLLRVLQDKHITPLGDDTSYPVEFRLVCATNKSLPKLVAAGEFREDLYHRLAAVTLCIPSLATRGQAEILYVASKFFPKLDEPAHEALRTFLISPTINLTGNVRQLLNLLERYKIFGRVIP